MAHQLSEQSLAVLKRIGAENDGVKAPSDEKGVQELIMALGFILMMSSAKKDKTPEDEAFLKQVDDCAHEFHDHQADVDIADLRSRLR